MGTTATSGILSHLSPLGPWPRLPFKLAYLALALALLAGAELYGKVLRVNAAKPMKHKLGAHTAGEFYPTFKFTPELLLPGA